ncbi:MAG TPA: phage tail sheath C-terminal domain-containing protein [Gemmataceae bacterium]|nr:phage tail sheath C-terminal domain-containing protein [Gemmataceae bacterium]
MSDDPSSGHDPVRQLLRSLEEAVSERILWVTCEPNAEPTWLRVRAEVAELLTGRWRDGALVGATPGQAFFVRCDRSTMSQADIDAGRLVCVVGVAPVRPAEFVIIRIEQLTADAKT